MSFLCGVIGGLFEAGCNEMFVLGYSLGQLPVLEHQPGFPLFSTILPYFPSSPDVPATVNFCTGVHFLRSLRPRWCPCLFRGATIDSPPNLTRATTTHYGIRYGVVPTETSSEAVIIKGFLKRGICGPAIPSIAADNPTSNKCSVRTYTFNLLRAPTITFCSLVQREATYRIITKGSRADRIYSLNSAFSPLGPS